MRAEQGSSEEYKSQLGYPNTSKTILHISANTFGARGPGQRRLSHTCTHTHTCTHAHTRAEPSSSSSSSTSFSTSPAPLLPPKPFSASTDKISSKRRQQKVPFSPIDSEPPGKNLGKLTQGNRGGKRREDSSPRGLGVINKQNIQGGPTGDRKQSYGWDEH